MGKKYNIPKLILFTERTSILADLFSFKNDETVQNEKIGEWFKKGECDLRKFKIINRVTIKKNDWIDILKKAKVPTLLVINRAYLTQNNNFINLVKSDIDLILHDECQNTSSKQCNSFLKHCKDLDVPIVGFSATPVRTGKKDKPLLLDIYSQSDDKSVLNLLTNYNMIYAIEHKLILPPEFFWYEIDKYNKYKQDDIDTQEIVDKDVKSILGLLNNIIDKLPNKKLVAWCGTIYMTKKWIEYFKESCKNYPKLQGFTFGIDTSDKSNPTNDYKNFRNCKGKSILFCANKHREGSDIKFLDGCIFLDKVKNRGAIPFIQSIGRVLRKCDDTPSKIKGIIIDCVAKEGNKYDKEVVDKIIGYYMALQNMSFVDDNDNNKIDLYVKLLKDIKFDKEKNSIEIKLGKNNIPIKINCNRLEWNNIVTQFKDVLGEKINISEQDKIKVDYIIDQKKNKKLNIRDNNEYINKVKEFGLTHSPEIKYDSIWTGWYDYLGIDTSKYPKTLANLSEICRKQKLLNLNEYLKNCEKYNLPTMPKELYKEYKSFDAIINETNKTNKIRKI